MGPAPAAQPDAQKPDEPGKPVHKLYIYDEVTASPKIDWSTYVVEPSQTSADYFREQLDAIPDGEPIELHVNSEGGSVAEGVAIYNQIRHKAEAGSPVIAYVDGIAYSVAVDICLAADEIHMGLGTSMFLHFPWMDACGNSTDLRRYADQLDSLGEASLQLYLNRTHGKVSEADLRAMMTAETLLDPEKCLQYGFCDFVDSVDRRTAPDGQDGAEPDKPQEQYSMLLAAQKEAEKALQELKKPEEPEKPAEKHFKQTLTAALKQLGK